MKPCVEVWQNAANEKWYWHLRASNGLIVLDGSQGYTRERDARRAFHRVKKLLRGVK